MDERIRTILEYAVMAPSGDNCQPWQLAVDGWQVDLFNDPGRDQSLYNLEQRASLIAHGAFLENLCLAATSTSLQVDVRLLPDSENSNHIARIGLEPKETSPSKLFPVITQRHTNREKYRPVKITDNQLQQWKSLPQRPGKKVWVSNRPEQIKSLAGLLSLNDRLVFGVPSLHRFLFEQIRWNDREAQETGDGLDIKTLGLGAMDRLSFNLLQHERLVSLLNRLGLPVIIQLKARQVLQTSSAFSVVTIPGVEPADYLHGGRLWQRLLLQLTSEGLAAQPIAGLACLMQTAREGLLDGKISAEQKGQLLNTRNELLNLIGEDASTVILAMFRIGKGPQVTCALRRPLKSFLLS